MNSVWRPLTADPETVVQQPGLLGMLLRPVAAEPKVLFGTVVLIGALMVAGHALVYWSGGTKYSGTFALLIPVLLGATIFLVPGALLAGVAAGLVLGPAMPLDVVASIAQPVESWAVRLGWFVGLGLFVALLVGVPRWNSALRNHALLVDQLSGLPTPNTLRHGARKLESGHAVAIDFGLYDRLLDTHGRDVANRFLGVAAFELKSALQTLAEARSLPLTRVQGDVFGALLPAEPAVLDRTVDAVLDGMPRWLSLDDSDVIDPGGQPLVVPLSIHVGIAEVTLSDLEGFDTFRNAIRAARRARETRLPIARFDASSLPVARENVQIAAELLQAIERGELFLQFQPKLRLADGTVCAAEALLRWQSPTRGLVSPGRFVPVAEQSALIHALTTWVVDQAGQTALQWRLDGHPLRLSINLSGRDLLDHETMEQVRQLPILTGIEAEAFSLEVTETAFIGNLDLMITHLEGLRGLGFDILVDDFGSGCSSFAYLHRLPVDGVKIDRSFVSAILTDQRAEDLVGAMLGWCHKLGMRTIAEGVEDAETVSALSAMGCDEIQGYWLSRPQSSRELFAWLERRSAAESGFEPLA